MNIQLNTSRKVELINITSQISKMMKQHKIGEKETMLHLFVPHTTAAITINETADPAVCTDLEKALQYLVPAVSFEHMEGNSPAHFLASIIGPHLTVPVFNNQLQLGTWQGILFCEFDGPRRRELKVF